MILCKGIELSSPYILAPLAGYTDLPFRELCRSHGASLAFTELISAEAVIRENRKTFKLMEISDTERPAGIQLFGKNPDTLVRAAIIAEEKFHPEIIDLNCGCSVTKVAGSGSGAALLKNPSLIFEIVSRIRAAVKCHVSAKIRLGWDDKSKNYADIVRILADAGASFVTVHGRTRSQKFSGSSDWNTITEIAAMSPIPVIGNGDIDSQSTASHLLKISGCKAVMIGRAAIGNPWIFSGEKPDITEIAVTARNHFTAMIDYYGDYGLILARKHLSQYFHGFKHAAVLRSNLVLASSAAQVTETLNEFIAEHKKED